MTHAQTLFLSVGSLALALGAAPYAEQGSGVVSADHPLASAAGAAVLDRGGNAVDAAVAAALAAGVVQPAGSGLGGGGFSVFDVGGVVGTLDFRETAPAAAHADLFVDDAGRVRPEWSRTGGLAVGVPGEAAGLAWLVHTHGRLSLRQVARPAILLARRGFPMGAHLAHALGRSEYEQVLAEFPDDHRVGVTVRRPALARTLRRWARSDGRSLQEGSDAADLVRAVAAQGGVMTNEDVAGYTPRERLPVTASFHGYTVVSMAPPSSGGLVLAQVLRVLDDVDLAALGLNSSAYIHRVTEAFKHAYADRASLLGDPDFVPIPDDALLSRARIEEVVGHFDPNRTFPPAFYGGGGAMPEDSGTQHISVIDADGNGAALTTTINTSFGSGVVVDRLGVVLNNEMDDFIARPGVPNAYGLIGSAANAVAPGKRPLSSTTPTLVLDHDGQVVLAIGASGGSQIISSVVQVLLDVLVFDLDPQAAVALPRFHHQWMPDTLVLDPELPADVVDALVARGHVIDRTPLYSAVQVVVTSPNGAGVMGGADPRKGGWPAATSAP